MIRNQRLRHYLDLVIVLTQKEMKVRYKSSFLGYVWSILHPLAFAFVFFLVFKIVMRIQMENYALFLIAGLFPWQWFSNSVNASPTVFLANSSIIKKVNFPRNITLLAVVLQDMLHFVLAIPVIVFFMFIYDETPSISWLYGIPILLGVQLIMTYGVSLGVSSINLFFRDMERLVVIFTMFVFYVTPVLYPQSMMPERYRPLFNLNPLAPLMTSWRNLFLHGRLDLWPLMLSLAYGLVAFTVGHSIYRRLSPRFAEML